MHAFLIISQDQELINHRVEKIITETNSQKMEFSIQKVAEIRELKSFLKINLPSKTAIIISNFNSVTPDAQNAFLKELEEPQEKLIYILSASTHENILPTILSRCEIIEINNTKIIIPPAIEAEIAQFLASNVGKKLNKVSLLKERSDAIEFMNNILKVSHMNLLKSKTSPHIIEQTNKTLKALKANGNVSLQLTNFVIQIS